MLAATERLDLEILNPLLEKAPPQKIVQWAAAEFGQELVMSSSFGAESALLLHMAAAELPRIRIIMVDTGFLFPETFAFMEELRRRFDLNVWVYRTRNDPFDYLKGAGENDPAWRHDIESCCAANKNEPFERAIVDLQPQGWLRGIRRSQSDARRSAQVLEWSRRYQCYAISPLLTWTSREIHAYMKEHDLPYHPLHQEGFLSIGCKPASCTRPVQLGQHPRSGRWIGSGKLECGINLTDSLDSAKL